MDLEAKKFQRAAKQVLKHLSAEVADMGKVVHRRAARVHAHQFIVEGDNLLELTGLCVIKF